MNSKDLDGHTPLYIASKNGYTAIINLLRKWENSNSRKGQDKEDLIKIANNNLARSHIMDLCEASKEADPKKNELSAFLWRRNKQKKRQFLVFSHY